LCRKKCWIIRIAACPFWKVHTAPRKFEAVNDAAIALVHEILGVGPDYQVLFMGGGASTQFALIPMSFVPAGQTAAYVDTGEFANKAMKECQIVAKAHVAFSSKDVKYTRVPKMNEIKYPEDVAYLHICSNNTIEGTQYHEFPETGKIPLIADMSSDIASRQLDYKKFAMFYAGAQKNLGPAGVTLVVIRNDSWRRPKPACPQCSPTRPMLIINHCIILPRFFAVYVMKTGIGVDQKTGRPGRC